MGRGTALLRGTGRETRALKRSFHMACSRQSTTMEGKECNLGTEAAILLQRAASKRTLSLQHSKDVPPGVMVLTLAKGCAQPPWLHTHAQLDVLGRELLGFLLQGRHPELAFLTAAGCGSPVPLQEPLPALVWVFINRTSPSPASAGGGLGRGNLEMGHVKERY